MGIYVADLGRMGDFYTRVLGFAVTDRGDLGDVRVVFLSLGPGQPGFQPVEDRRRALAERLN